MIYEATIDGRTVQVRVEHADNGSYRVQLGDGPEQFIDTRRPVPDVLNMLIDGHSWEAGLVSTDEGFEVEVLGVQHMVELVDPRRKALKLAGGAGADVVRTQMPGRVVRLLAEEGQTVAKGTPLLVVEAMKMENEIKAPRGGVVKRIAVGEGDLVEAKAVLVELE